MAEKQIFYVKWTQSIQISWFNQIHLWNSLTIMNHQLRITVKKKFNIFKHQVFIVSPPTHLSTMVTSHAKFIFRRTRRWQNWCFARLLSVTNNYAVASQSANGPKSKYKNRKRLNLKILCFIIVLQDMITCV